MSSGGKAPWPARVLRLAGSLVLALAFATTLATVGWILGGLTFLTIAPLPPIPYLHLSPLAPWPTVLALALLPFAWFAILRRNRRPAALVVLTAVVLIPAAYPWSNLDWSLLLKDLDLAHGGVPQPHIVALASFPLLLIALLHGTATAREAPRHYRRKGIPPEEARRAGPAVARAATVATLGGLAATTFLALGLATVPPALATVPDLGALGAPVATALLFLAVVLLLLRERGAEEGSEERDVP